MNPEKEGPKRRIVFSSVAAAQFKQLMGAEAPGEVDPSIKVPPVASELTPWERTKFGRMMGQVPKKFSVNPRGGQQTGMSVGFSIGGYDVWLIMAKIKGIDFNRDQLAKNEYLDIDIGERSFRWVEEAERGIDLIFGDTEQEVRINTRLWCASECEDPSAQSN